ncbi:MAG: TIGR03915 family putative DNA repair protein, partial [Alphaproteobacteria bacterium]|nr:TIGR03915 family putative DNA repair protein [Alphaproteobacteria bacterium]
MYSARLPQPADFDAWRNHARALLASGIEPADVTWLDGGADEDLFADMQTAAPLDPGTPLSVPRRYAELARAAICHSDPARFALLYRLLWRIVNENRALLSVATDPDVARTNKLAKAVRRDSHKMKAFVRFRAISDQAGEAFVAWFEPDHHIVERTAPFFARRFTGMRWSIL